MELLDTETRITALEHALNLQLESISKQRQALKSGRNGNPSFGSAIELLERQTVSRSEQNATVCAALQYVIDDLKQQTKNKSRTRFEKALLRHEIAGIEARKHAMCNYSA